jgi:16S rRNA (cytidine1402-2'-O)-methyltransferase
VVSAGRLLVVSTPIGHLGDFSFRGVEALRAAHVIAAEDTRHTRKLLAQYGITTPLTSLHAHSGAARIERLLDRVAAGHTVAYVTDAGTPGVSDPGGRLAERAHQRGLAVVPIPGASAVLAALAGAGFPADRFVFLGFLPRKGRARDELLGRIAAESLTTVCYEAPGRTSPLLDDLAERCGMERPAAVARELTKLHEDIRRGTLGELATYYRENPPRGEVTVVIGGRTESAAGAAAEPVPDVASLARELAGTGTPAAIAKKLARRLGISRQEAYRVVTELE